MSEINTEGISEEKENSSSGTSSKRCKYCTCESGCCRSRHSHSGHHSHHSHHSGSSRNSSGVSHTAVSSRRSSADYESDIEEDDISSEMERNGDNIIYRNVRKVKVFMMIKRTIFCCVALALIIFVISAIINSQPGDSLSFFTNRDKKLEETNDLKIKIIQYEDKIKELEERLSRYEADSLPDDDTETDDAIDENDGE